MTTQTLALLIVATIFAQVIVYMLIAFYRHWENYQALLLRAGALPASPAPAVSLPHTGKAVWEGYRPFRVARKVYENAERSICSFYLAPLDEQPLPAFAPGQYLTFRLELTDPPRQIVRCYSLSTRPHTDYYRITVKRLPPVAPEALPGLASNHLHDHVEEGDVLQVKAPAGHFHLLPDNPLPIVLIGGGIGITPMLGILDSLAHNNDKREVWLFYGVRNEAEQIMGEHLRVLAAAHPDFHLRLCHSRPAEQEREGIDYQHLGHVGIRLLRLTLKLQAYQFFVCGPKAMMESLVPALEEWGVPPQNLHYEAFGPASLVRPAALPSTGSGSAARTVEFRKSGRRIPWEPRYASLLEFAEAHGIAVDSGCRAGSCGSCRTPLASGEVDYSQAPDAELEAGTCLLCISIPRTDVSLSA